MKTLSYIGIFLVACIFTGCTSGNKNSAADDFTIASYYFPNYHVDKRNEKVHGEGWTEWELVKEAKPRFPDHQQPKVPSWGYTDEADPRQMAQKIKAAAGYGIDAFIFDWYYYDDGLFLERAIEEGFFGAKNNKRIKFGLMWANHDWMDIHPVDSATLLSEEGPEVLYQGVISLETWDRMTDYIIETYFKHPSYWMIDGAPYFSVYDMSRFLSIFGSKENAVSGIEGFRNKVIKAGFPDLHLNAVVWGRTILPSEEKIVVEDMNAFLQELGFSSTTSYVWVHHAKVGFPAEDYNSMKERYFNYAGEFCETIDLPYFPNVTMGWDASPRCKQSDTFRELRYPFTGTMSNNTPENFKEALLDAKQFMAMHADGPNILTINCWNEWTEGSYLEPDTIHGMDYLQAVKEVFGD
ncbi:glycoside hydrolase family 99-like domain-containing protein [Bacteroidota bacterium]